MNRVENLDPQEMFRYWESEYNHTPVKIEQLAKESDLSDEEIAMCYILSPYEIMRNTNIVVPKVFVLHFLTSNYVDTVKIEVLNRPDVQEYFEIALDAFLRYWIRFYKKNAYHKHEYLGEEAKDEFIKIIASQPNWVFTWDNVRTFLDYASYRARAKEIQQIIERISNQRSEKIPEDIQERIENLYK